MILVFNHRIDLILIMAVALILLGVVYSIVMLVMSRFEPRTPLVDTGDMSCRSARHTIFVVPCLNEETVIGASVQRLLSLQGSSFDVLVIDDGSDDGTAEIVSSFHDSRVHLLQRVAPNAQQGKGEALNAAYSHIVTGKLGTQFDPDTTIICVVDADGRLEANTIDVVFPFFDDATVGAVQIGVRINNRHHNLLARLQDLEFVLYTQVFQRGRRHLQSIGLGGNGQFVRLAALASLGSKPWTRSLSEDLDLGVRIYLAGWDMEFCSDTAVHQQGLVHMRRWVEQRTRWFQGHLQSWPLVPWVLSTLKGLRRVDLLYHLTSPYVLLVASLLSAGFGLWILQLGVSIATGHIEPSWWWLTAYLVAFGPALAFGLVYHRHERAYGLSRLKAITLMHLYVVYSTLWYVAGWSATMRFLLRRNGWSKTERVAEEQEHQTISFTPTVLA